MVELFVIGSIGTKSEINVIVPFQTTNIDTMNSAGNCSRKFSCIIISLHITTLRYTDKYGNRIGPCACSFKF